jgi:hypothetical protein
MVGIYKVDMNEDGDNIFTISSTVSLFKLPKKV